MDDLINRKALAEWVHANVPAYTPDALITKSFVMAALSTKSITPSVPAVPLDKLCEWLETDCILSCVSCEHLFGGQWCKQHPELPYRCHRKEHWKDALTKWMEGQDAKKET